MTDVNERPLATFGILSFNQKSYLEKALEGAEAQTYRPLEIVISDDGSKDGSWETILSWRDAFTARHPDVQVVVNRNEPNLGMFANWQKIAELARGEIIIKADGDDISLPERTAVVVDAWVKDGKRAAAVFNAGWKIDPNGNRIGLIDAPSYEHPTGALSNWTKRCFSEFDNTLQHPRIVDDVPYAWRAQALGPELRIEKPLVLYRVGTGVSTSLFKFREGWARSAQCGIDALEQTRDDMPVMRRLLSAGDFDKLNLAIRLQRDSLCIIRDVCMGKSMRERFRAFQEANRIMPCPRSSPLYWLRMALLMPRAMGDGVLSVYMTLNYLRKRIMGRRG